MFNSMSDTLAPRMMVIVVEVRHRTDVVRVLYQSRTDDGKRPNSCRKRSLPLAAIDCLTHDGVSGDFLDSIDDGGSSMKDDLFLGDIFGWSGGHRAFGPTGSKIAASKVRCRRSRRTRPAIVSSGLNGA
jgi:hypothetical protein